VKISGAASGDRPSCREVSCCCRCCCWAPKGASQCHSCRWSCRAGGCGDERSARERCGGCEVSTAAALCACKVVGSGRMALLRRLLRLGRLPRRSPAALPSWPPRAPRKVRRGGVPVQAGRCPRLPGVTTRAELWWVVAAPGEPGRVTSSEGDSGPARAPVGASSSSTDSGPPRALVTPFGPASPRREAASSPRDSAPSRGMSPRGRSSQRATPVGREQVDDHE